MSREIYFISDILRFLNYRVQEYTVYIIFYEKLVYLFIYFLNYNMHNHFLGADILLS